jgi:hypothetical protein
MQIIKSFEDIAAEVKAAREAGKPLKQAALQKQYDLTDEDYQIVLDLSY